MAYDEKDRDLDYEQSAYEQDPAYEADTYFAERLDQSPEEDEALEEDEPLEEDYSDEFGEQVVTDEPTAETVDDTVQTKDSKLRPDDETVE